eukprot:4849-Heterococcus_DN1.PRE.1
MERHAEREQHCLPPASARFKVRLSVNTARWQACVHILSTAGLVPVKQMALLHLAQRAERQATARHSAETSD